MIRTRLTAAPAVAMTVVSMVLTLAVVVGWLGAVMPWQVALVVGVGLDGGWLATLAYERRLAAQGDHSRAVTGLGWCFGVVATGVLVAHALTSTAPAAWLAVSWLPLAAKALWLVHGLWERTALTPRALGEIRRIQQAARDDAAVARAWLRSEATTEETRLSAVTAAGARVARVQARTAQGLAQAWQALDHAREVDGTDSALACVTGRVTPGVTPRWDLPVWGAASTVALPSGGSSDSVYDREVGDLVSTMTPQVTAAAPVTVQTPAPEVDSPGDRLDSAAARRAIEGAWEAGLTVREAATVATRSPSYVGGVYAQLAKARGVQPLRGQTSIPVAAA